MNDWTANLSEVVAEVRERFERYEQALIEKDLEVLDATFWNSPHTIRYAMHENGYGFDQIHQHRSARPPGPDIKEKRIRRPSVRSMAPDHRCRLTLRELSHNSVTL